MSNDLFNDAFELNEFLSNLCNETNNNKIYFKNKTEIILDCYKNNNYTNYLNLTFFNNFISEIENSISNITLKCGKLIDNFYIGLMIIKIFHQNQLNQI